MASLTKTRPFLARAGAAQLLRMRRIDQHEAGHLVGMTARIELDVKTADGMTDQHIGRRDPLGPKGRAEFLDDGDAVARRRRRRTRADAGTIIGENGGFRRDVRQNLGPPLQSTAESVFEHHGRHASSCDDVLDLSLGKDRRCDAVHRDATADCENRDEKCRDDTARAPNA
ncbi:hypothetical protein MMG94_10755 [Methylocystis parvus OBBP]|nr:hypothetical protein [Methylocystis parvus]WBJ98515.1 hypothetical protein MMG94_10755 [Methylocystis parvus OBBP]